MKVEVDLKLKVTFESGEEASRFYRALLPDFSDIKMSLESNSVIMELTGLPPSRARALANSLLRMAQLYQRMSEALT